MSKNDEILNILQECYSLLTRLEPIVEQVGLPPDLLQKFDAVKTKLQGHTSNGASASGGSDKNVVEQEIYCDIEPPIPAAAAVPARQTVSPREETDNQDETEVPEISVEAVKMAAAKAGYLDKKRPEKGLSKLAMVKYQKRYCVIADGIFYYFDNENAKKQAGAFHLTEYEASTAYHLFKDVKKQAGSFQLTSPGLRSYQFVASSFEDMKEWVQTVAKFSRYTHHEVLQPPAYAKSPKRSVSGDSNGADSDASNEQSSASGSISSFKKKRLPSIPTESTQDVYDDAAATELPSQEVCDDAAVAPAQTPGQEVYDDAAAAPAQEENYDEASAPAPPSLSRLRALSKKAPVVDNQETYDDAEAALAPTKDTQKNDDTSAAPPMPSIARLEAIKLYQQGEEAYDDAQAGGTQRHSPGSVKNAPQDPEEHYDDAKPLPTGLFSGSAKPAKQLPPTPKNKPLPNVPKTQSPESSEETYDDAVVGPDVNKPMKSLPELPKGKPLPTPPISQNDEPEENYDDASTVDVTKRPLPMPKRSIVVAEDDYENHFYGLCDCKANKPHELSFNAGDILHVVERKYESSGWLTAILDGKIGLVPMSFLTPAYTLA